MNKWACLTLCNCFRSAGYFFIEINRRIHEILAIGDCPCWLEAAFYFLSLTLDTIPIGVAYAIWSGVGVAAIAAISVLAFDQKMDVAGYLGIILIVAGVVVLRLFSESSIE